MADPLCGMCGGRGWVREMGSEHACFRCRGAEIFGTTSRNSGNATLPAFTCGRLDCKRVAKFKCAHCGRNLCGPCTDKRDCCTKQKAVG